MTASVEHRLQGLEPDNLLAFLALLGLLRALETARPLWRPRIRWSLDNPPLRPVLVLRAAQTQDAVAEAAAEGAAALAPANALGNRLDLNHDVAAARQTLTAARTDPEKARVASALMSDAAVKVTMGKPQDQIEPTPLCLLFGQGHQHFLDRFAAVPAQPAPPPRGRGKKAVEVTAAMSMAEALFQVWRREDPTFSFRWDPAEDVRYALMAGDPSYAGNKEGTQHGANRLAALGVAVLTAAPAERGGQVRLGLPGGSREGGFSLGWPVWRSALSLEAIRSLLASPDLRDDTVWSRLGVDHLRTARRISVGKFMNFTSAVLIAGDLGAGDRP